MAIAAASCCRLTPFGHGSPENHIQRIELIWRASPRIARKQMQQKCARAECRG